IFSDYRIESNNQNEIYLEIQSLDSMHRALKSAAEASWLIMRLCKKGGKPILSLDIRVATMSNRETLIVQDIAIKVLKPSEMNSFTEPLCPEPPVYIVLPPLESMKSVIERLKNLDGKIRIRMNRAGELRLKTVCDPAVIEVEWRGCNNPNLEDEETRRAREEEPPNTFHSVSIASKNLARFLTSYAMGKVCIACVCPGHSVIFYVYIGSFRNPGGIMTFYVPAFDDEDDE
ncbi:cell cycle checkpoint, partial [Atractiella rhizophila]